MNAPPTHNAPSLGFWLVAPLAAVVTWTAHELAPERPLARYNVAALLTMRGRHADAIPVLLDHLRRSPEDPQGWRLATSVVQRYMKDEAWEPGFEFQAAVVELMRGEDAPGYDLETARKVLEALRARARP